MFGGGGGGGWGWLGISPHKKLNKLLMLIPLLQNYEKAHVNLPLHIHVSGLVKGVG